MKNVKGFHAFRSILKDACDNVGGDLASYNEVLILRNTLLEILDEHISSIIHGENIATYTSSSKTCGNNYVNNKRVDTPLKRAEKYGVTRSSLDAISDSTSSSSHTRQINVHAIELYKKPISIVMRDGEIKNRHGKVAVYTTYDEAVAGSSETIKKDTIHIFNNASKAGKYVCEVKNGGICPHRSVNCDMRKQYTEIHKKRANVNEPVTLNDCIRRFPGTTNMFGFWCDEFEMLLSVKDTAYIVDKTG